MAKLAIEKDCTGLLGRLPPELRNNIYELVFQPDIVTVEASKVALLESEPPAKALVCTCRQIYREVSELYKAEYRKFWEDSHFVIKSDLEDLTTFKKLKNLRAAALGHVRHITLRNMLTEDFFLGYSLLPNRSGWIRWVHMKGYRPDSTIFYYFAPPSPNHTSDEYVCYAKQEKDVSPERQEQYRQHRLPVTSKRLGIQDQLLAVLSLDGLSPSTTSGVTWTFNP